MDLTRSAVARLLDHTLLRPEATSGDIRAICAEALRHGVLNVCVSPAWIPLAIEQLAGSSTGICTVVDFPLGSGGPERKRQDARRAIEAGASELDMVMAIGRLKDGDDACVQDEIAVVVEEAEGRVVKVILEAALLDTGELERACRIAMRGGASFVKTSTGFFGGARVEMVRRMRRVVGDALGVKAAGGIRDAATARAMIEAGANRIGSSASVAILEGWPVSDRRTKG